jgi:hypothetical protein
MYTTSVRGRVLCSPDLNSLRLLSPQTLINPSELSFTYKLRDTTHFNVCQITCNSPGGFETSRYSMIRRDHLCIFSDGGNFEHLLLAVIE